MVVVIVYCVSKSIVVTTSVNVSYITRLGNVTVLAVTFVLVTVNPSAVSTDGLPEASSINLKLLTAADLGFDPYYCKFFSFEIFAEASIMITNPVYAYWGGVDRYDGYGYWGTVGRRKNTAFPIVQGVYNSGEKVHLVINEKSPHQETGGTMFWAVLPTSIALENYDINATDNRWDAEEWDKDKNSIKKFD